MGVPWEPRRNPVDGFSKEPGENRMHLRLHKPEKPPAPPTPTLSRGVCVEAAGAELRGALDVPTGARGLVLFASNRHLGRIDPRQANLARELNRRGLGTLLVDLVEAATARASAATSTC